MLSSILSIQNLFDPAIKYVHTESLVHLLIELIEHFETNKLVDGENSRNAALDAVIQMLQSEKTNG